MRDLEASVIVSPPSADHPPHRERRAAGRHPAVVRQARIAWHEGHGRFRVEAAELVDISANAACLIFEGTMAQGRAVWLGLESLPWEWVGATARPSPRPGRPGHYLLEFRESCPAGLFEHATIDPAAEKSAPPIDMNLSYCWGC